MDGSESFIADGRPLLRHGEVAPLHNSINTKKPLSKSGCSFLAVLRFILKKWFDAGTVC